MNRETVLAIVGILGWLAFVFMFWRNGVLAKKNEAQRQLLEAPQVPKKPEKPSRIRVYVPAVPGAPVSHVVYGLRVQQPDGRLIVVDEEDKIAAVFGPGWIAAIVEQDPVTPAPNPLERPKPKEGA
jgi:hypothetical protein